MKVKLKQCVKRGREDTRIDPRRLTDPKIRDMFQAKMNDKLMEVKNTIDFTVVENAWSTIKNVIVEVSKSELKTVEESCK